MLVYIASDTGYTEHVVLAGLSISYVLSVSGFRRVQNAKIRRGRLFNKNSFSSVLMYVHMNMQAYVRSVCVVNCHRPT